MSHFLKLTTQFINTRYITLVDLQPGKYKFYINKNNDPGLKGWLIYGSGIINSDNTTITVCEKEDPVDYKIVTDWISKN